MSDSLLSNGPFGIHLLRPTALFGLEGLPSLSHGVLWTLVFNIGGYVLGSVLLPATDAEQRLADDFVELEHDEGHLDDGGEATFDAGQQRANAEKVLCQYFSLTEAQLIVRRAAEAAGLSARASITAVEWAELNNQVERSLAGVIGSASAHAAMQQRNLMDVTASGALERAYAKMLARMRISPAELRKKMDYHRERETLLQQQAAELEQRVDERTRELTSANEALRSEVAERQKAQAEVLGMTEKLADAAHRAGKAEVATNVLHNVGNVLNSVIVSVRVATERVKSSRVANVGRVSELMLAHEADLGTFTQQDPQGKRLVGYLKNLADHLTSEQRELLVELEGVSTKADHVKHIVAVQQEFAGDSNFRQSTDVTSLIEDAIRINMLELQVAEIVRDFAAGPRVSMSKHKVLQILINLLSNAKHAVNHPEVTGDKRVTVRLERPRTDWLVFEVIDTGVGISAEDLGRIFQHGFTTRKDGHGFGLHGAITAAREMGGSLTASSRGRGHGSTFRLEVPCSAESGVDAAAE